MDVEKMHVESSKVTLIKSAIIVFALAAIVGGYLLFQSKYKESYTVTQAPKGEAVVDFPSGLIVEKDVAIQDSYSLAYSGNLSQPVVTYFSKWTMAQNIDEFGAYLKNNGWTITHEADLLLKNTFYYANKDNNDVNITLAEEAGKTRAPSAKGAPSSPLVVVTISYVKR